MRWSSLFLALFAATAVADEVRLKDGTVLSGRCTESGGRVFVVDRNKKWVLKRSEIAEITKKKSFMDEYEERLAALPADDPEAIYEFGLWLEKNDWKAKAHRAYEEVITLDPDHREARRKLGYERYEGEWVSPEEMNRKKGLVEFEGAWYTPRELAELKAEMERDATLRGRIQQRRELRKKLNAIVKDFASFDKRKRRKAHATLSAYADKIRSPELRKFADDTLAYYDEMVRRICAQLRARTEVNVALTKLKKPIETFETSLGAASIGIVPSQNPVRIQLPEISIVEAHTTVDIPAGCE